MYIRSSTAHQPPSAKRLAATSPCTCLLHVKITISTLIMPLTWNVPNNTAEPAEAPSNAAPSSASPISWLSRPSGPWRTAALSASCSVETGILPLFRNGLAPNTEYSGSSVSRTAAAAVPCSQLYKKKCEGERGREAKRLIQCGPGANGTEHSRFYAVHASDILLVQRLGELLLPYHRGYQQRVRQDRMKKRGAHDRGVKRRDVRSGGQEGRYL